MNRVLIVYGTTEGHTRKVCDAMAGTLERLGVATDVCEAGPADPLPAGYDGIIVAASIHGGRYQRAVVKWVRARAAEFGDRPTVFVSVSLAAVNQQRDPKAAAALAANAEYFCDLTGWWPGRVAHVAGALPYTKYNVFKRWMMKRIVASQGGDTDVSKDYEYTDWAAVRALAADFGRRLKAAA